VSNGRFCAIAAYFYSISVKMARQMAHLVNALRRRPGADRTADRLPPVRAGDGDAQGRRSLSYAQVRERTSRVSASWHVVEVMAKRRA
jgi:hypothetical protein